MTAEQRHAGHPAGAARHDGWQAERMHARREKPYVREAQGRHTGCRWACVWLTQLVYFGLPWLGWNGRPAVLFDLGLRKFYLFSLVLWPQDFIYLATLLVLCACLLFLSSAVAGRVWCGFGCPHTVYTGIFMEIERRIEGGRAARMRLDAQPLSPPKAAKKLAKHGAWLLLSAWIGITLVGYFTPIRTLLAELIAFSPGPWESFWICCYGGLAYMNAGWMREQFCKHICAYARFQGVMSDRDTLIISYDRARGEPRGLRRRNRDLQAQRQGDCVDCTICIQVCPAGIDIREGFQYECIDCGACIDACDAVMDKIGMPRGLIRYTSANANELHLSARQMRRRIRRPRVLVYAGMLAAGTVLYVAALASRPRIRMDVIPDRGAVRVMTDGAVENVYRLQVMNMDERPHRMRITVSPGNAFQAETAGEYDIEATSSRAIPFRVRMPASAAGADPSPIEFAVDAHDIPLSKIREKSVFRTAQPP